MNAPRPYSAASSCRICNCNDLVEILDLGEQALASCFPRSKDEPVVSGPLELVLCTDCKLVQLRHSMSPEAMYTHDYGYRSGLNTTMRGHLAGIAAWIESYVSLNPGDIVLDIGCNDGTLLGSYKSEGLRLLGIDPIAGKFRDSYPAHFDIHQGYFSAKAFRELVPGEMKVKTATSIAMFYDLERPQDFVDDVASILAPDGVWVLEQSYMPTMLRTNSFDTICHEHLEYYCLAQIERMVNRGSMRVFRVELNDTNGGSFRVAVCHKDAPYAEDAKVLGAMRAEEAALYADRERVFADFRARIEKLKCDARRCLEDLKAQGKSIHLYGASTKGNTLLQYYGLDHRLLDYSAERNPDKYGHLTPKTLVPIISEAQSRAMNPDVYFVLPWHFRKEFIEREADFLAKGGKMIFPLPELQIVGS